MPALRRPSLPSALGAFAAVVLNLVACRASPTQTPENGAAQRSPQPEATRGVVRAERVVGGLVNPWALAFLPDGRMLVTEKPGRLRVVTTAGAVSAPITGLPDVWARGQGGLLDVALDPQFATNRLVYLSFADAGPDGSNGTAVARGRLNAAATALEGTRVIYRQTPKVQSGGHFGSRLVFGRDGRLWVTQGDRQQERWRTQAQELGSGIGKIVRIAADGSIPPDNPFATRAGARPEVWSYGHRNVQAAALHPTTGELWTVEHGARGGDELNRPMAGRNYGWPVITYGVDYSGARIGEGTARQGMEQPVYYWDPVIAPSGATFVTGNRYPGWAGSLVVGGLASKVLVRLVMEGDAANPRVAREERHLADFGQRIRDVQQGPDGFLYVVTDDDDGQVARVVPASR
jgi:glucose/arabinose dehydrogenase